MSDTLTTIEHAYRAALARFKPVSDSPGLDAHLLLGAVLNVERAYLLAHPDRELAPEQAAQWAAWVERRASGEPLPYILGRRAFYDREFIVTPDVLIPRPETELLLERALVFMREHSGGAAVDVGTGSGALAVTLAAHAPDASVCAVDISPAALAVARRNAVRHGVEARIRFFEGDLLVPLLEQGWRVDLVLANLPYIASGELADLAVSRHEPALALDGGVDGLDLIRRLLEQLPAVMRPGGLALLEIGANQGEAAFKLGQALAPLVCAVEIVRDYAGLDRILVLNFAEMSG